MSVQSLIFEELLQPWGWRVSLALAGVPAIVLTLGGIFLPDTPNSLIERGKVTLASHTQAHVLKQAPNQEMNSV